MGLFWRVLRGVVLGVVLGGPVAAQVPAGGWPRCTAARDGQQVGANGSVCECRYQSGGTMLRRPAGWRWSCDILQMDGDGRGDVLSGPAPLPPGFVYSPQVGGNQGMPAPPDAYGGGWRR